MLLEVLNLKFYSKYGNYTTRINKGGEDIVISFNKNQYSTEDSAEIEALEKHPNFGEKKLFWPVKKLEDVINPNKDDDIVAELKPFKNKLLARLNNLGIAEKYDEVIEGAIESDNIKVSSVCKTLFVELTKLPDEEILKLGG
jgi:hypothetical protein